MSTRVKELIVILAIALVIFRIARPIVLRFSSQSDFSRRRNVWCALTITAFLSVNFWWYSVVAIPLLLWAGRRDENPAALYLLLLQVIPTVPIDIPVAGIQHLFPLDNYRLLSLCVLIPAAWRLRRRKPGAPVRGFDTMDILLLAYGALQIAFFTRPDLPDNSFLQDSATNMLRRAFLYFLDVYVLYYVVSRSCNERRTIVDAMAAFCTACAVMSGLAIFEAAKRWLLYSDIGAVWTGDPTFGFYLLRGDTIRAQASAGHPLALGYLLAIAFGFWLYLSSHMSASRSRLIVSLLYLTGLIAAYSRGPWIGAATVFFVFIALRPRRLSYFLKSAAVASVVAVAVGMTPVGNRILRVLPFMGGSIDTGSIDYRERLLERSWQLIQENIFFGDQFVLSKMADLRQGQGIIDLVNTYVEVTLQKGLVGLSLFVGFILIALIRAYRPTRALITTDPDLALLGASLVACILGTLLMIENCSFIYGYEKMFYVLAGLATGYAHFSQVRQRKGAHSPTNLLPNGSRCLTVNI